MGEWGVVERWEVGEGGVMCYLQDKRSVLQQNLVSGMYFVKVLEEGKTVFSEKLIVQ